MKEQWRSCPRPRKHVERTPRCNLGTATSGLMPRVTATGMQGQLRCDVISMCPPARSRADQTGPSGTHWPRVC
ncbi:hypothetical protein NQZ68_040143 [Dissostichus eleginoides]|nr:hypothetical protein NQZ68_040143 [Dissostichus eleginoides]